LLAVEPSGTSAVIWSSGRGEAVLGDPWNICELTDEDRGNKNL